LIYTIEYLKRKNAKRRHLRAIIVIKIQYIFMRFGVNVLVILK